MARSATRLIYSPRATWAWTRLREKLRRWKNMRPSSTRLEATNMQSRFSKWKWRLLKPMCGILCHFAPDGSVAEHTMRGGLVALHHRGPDGAGLWISPDRRVAIGHTRLALIGIENGAQPIANEDGQIVAAINGEFYGFEGIRADLETNGHRFATSSDSEILLHLYEEHGTDCLRFLRGEFAFVLWDGRTARRLQRRCDQRSESNRFAFRTCRDHVWIASGSESALFAHAA